MTVHRLAHPSLTLLSGFVRPCVDRVRGGARWIVGKLGVALSFIAPLIWLTTWFMLFRTAFRTGTWF